MSGGRPRIFTAVRTHQTGRVNIFTVILLRHQTLVKDFIMVTSLILKINS